MKKTLIIIMSLMALIGNAQEVKRIDVKGRIIVSIEDKEGVTVYNTSSNEGTVTDKNGEFQLKVALNDIVEFGAIQFQDFEVSISNDVLKSKQLTVILVEEVNKLDEVVILPFGLTGNINSDLENVRTYNVSLDYVYFGLDHIEDFEFSADFNSRVENVAFNENNPRVDNMLNVVNLAGFILGQVVDLDKNKTSKRDEILNRTPFKKALDNYSVNYIHSNFNIPLEQVDSFIQFVETEGVDSRLLAKDKELQFLERITQLSKTFLNSKRDED